MYKERRVWVFVLFASVKNTNEAEVTKRKKRFLKEDKERRLVSLS
jgi:hypothetical protein